MLICMRSQITQRQRAEFASRFRLALMQNGNQSAPSAGSPTATPSAQAQHLAQQLSGQMDYMRQQQPQMYQQFTTQPQGPQGSSSQQVGMAPQMGLQPTQGGMFMPAMPLPPSRAVPLFGGTSSSSSSGYPGPVAFQVPMGNGAGRGKRKATAGSNGTKRDKSIRRFVCSTVLVLDLTVAGSIPLRDMLFLKERPDSTPQKFAADWHSCEVELNNNLTFPVRSPWRLQIRKLFFCSYCSATCGTSASPMASGLRRRIRKTSR